MGWNSVCYCVFLMIFAGVVWADPLVSESEGEATKVTKEEDEPIPGFVLKDQHRSTYCFQPSSTRVRLVGIGDRHSAQWAEGWYRPIAARYGEQVEVLAIGALKTLPFLWRPWLRWLLRREVEVPVLLDWKDEVVPLFDFRPRELCIYVIDYEGKVVLRLFGKASEEKLAQLYALTDTLLKKEERAETLEARVSK